MADQSTSPANWNLTSARRGFDAVKEGGEVVMRKVVAGLEKEEGKRSPCHGCRGSGQLCHKGQTQPTDKDPPCWFCLGIGLLPVTDLQGFLLAHNPSLFRTTDEQYYKGPPVRIRLYLAKYPGAQCKFVTSRMSKETKRSLFGTVASAGSVDGNSVDSSSSTDGALKSRLPRLRDKAHRTVAEVNTRLRTSDSAAESQSPSTASNESTASEWNGGERSPHRHRRGRERGSLPGDRSDSKLKSRDVSPSRQDGSAFSPSSHASQQQSNNPSTLSSHGGSSPSKGRWTERGEEIDGSDSPRSPSSSSSAGPRPRSPRRERNRIREKEQREAMERARRLQRALSPRASLPAGNGGSPGLEGARQIAGGRWESQGLDKAEKAGGPTSFLSSVFKGS